MKNIVSIILIAWSISSCSDWLDVQPKTAIPADKLFETESGFRDALTGFYLKMTDIGLYGKELSYGYIEALACNYDRVIPNSEVCHGNRGYTNTTIFFYPKRTVSI